MPLTRFRHAEPALRVLYGDDALRGLGEELRRLGARRAVLFCGRSLALASPGVATVREALGELCAGVFDGVRPHSPVAAVLAGRDALAGFKADAVIALGGGSAIVTARAATILLAESQPLERLCTRFVPGQPPESPRLAAAKLPQLLVPTTPTTAAVRAGAAVTDAEHRRLALFDPKVRPAALCLLPSLLASVPAPVFLDAALNTFASTIQGLESARREPLADARLLHALRLLAQYLPLPDAGLRASGLASGAAIDGTAEARGQLMLAAVLAGQGVDVTGAGVASALAHAIGVQCGVGNGLAAAIVLPHTLRYNAAATDHRLGAALGALGGAADARPAAQAVSEQCAALLQKLGLPVRLRDAGVKQADLPQLAQRATEDWFTSQNPAAVRSQDIVELLHAAW
jgi:alcohol dehydrogenase class IV